MIVQGEIRGGVYFDSVTLMIAARDLTSAAGVLDAAIVMATPENQSILKSAGLWLDEFARAGDTDLIVAVKADSDSTARGALASAADHLKSVRGRSDAADTQRPVSLSGALSTLPGANLALISVAGRYAADLARQALDRGLHVLLFSDNVPLEREIELKQYARSKGLLLMGPDCGTAIINGVPLAFANAVARGDIGIVAAAGTGLQEISSIISNSGAGISQAIGTGGRDVKEAVGGIMFLEALAALCDDPATRVIVLVSKPPHRSVLGRIGRAVADVSKPVIAAFVGADPDLAATFGMHPALSLEEAAWMAVAASARRKMELAKADLRHRDGEIDHQAVQFAREIRHGRKYVRGLFSGGTFCAEAQSIFARQGVCDVFSNVASPPCQPLADPWTSRGHSLIDLGDDAFTVGRPHPMIDFSLRNRRILDESKDAETALILLDVVLGYGAHRDPVSELAPVVAEAARRVAIACSVTGTPQDPQDRGKVEGGLIAAGARVWPSNAAASRFAAIAGKTLGGC